MKSVSLGCLIGILLLVGTSPARAWGRDGHRITCEMAYRNLEPQTKAWVDQTLLGEQESFAQTCLWADKVKRTTHPETYNEHFINAAPGAKNLDLERDCADGVCIVRAIEKYSNQLINPGVDRDLRRDALKFLGHLMGDIHQPLHCGRLVDLGGNLTRTCFMGDCGWPDRPVNLHQVWDTIILAFSGEPWQSFADRMSGRVLGQEMIWPADTPLEWARESLDLAEEFVYPALPPWGVDEPYYRQAYPMIEQRLLLGSARLARLLEVLAKQSRLAEESASSPPAHGSDRANPPRPEPSRK